MRALLQTNSSTNTEWKVLSDCLPVVSVNNVVLAEGGVMAQGTGCRVGEPVPCPASTPPGLYSSSRHKGGSSGLRKRSGTCVKAVDLM